MKIYVVIHENAEEPGKGGEIKLAPTQAVARKAMCMDVAKILPDYNIDDTDVAFDDQFWGDSNKRELSWNGKVRETWRIEEHELDAKAIVKVKGGMVQSVIANADVDVDVFDLDVSSYPDEGEEDEADRKDRKFQELLGRPDWWCVW